MRIAVIAVHGVGGPERNATARAVADLLVKHGAPGGDYSEFRETCLTLPVEPLVVPGAAERSSSRLGGLLIGDRDRTTLSPPPRAAGSATDAPDVAFMRNQLQNYESSNDPFDTIELIGRRGKGTAAREVHVFEMYWADLSRVGSGAARILGACLQLVQHVSHLGRKALDVASQADAGASPGESATSFALRAYAYAHRVVVRLFTIFVPVSSLLMLSFVALFVPAAVAPPHRLLAGLVAAVLLVLAVVGALWFAASKTERAVSGFVWVMVGVVIAGGGVYAWLHGDGAVTAAVLLTAVIGTLALAAYLAVLRAYERDREGALAWGVVSLVVVALLTVRSTFGFPPQQDPAENVRWFAFLGFQWSFLALVASWGALWISTFVAFAIYGAAVRPTFW